MGFAYNEWVSWKLWLNHLEDKMWKNKPQFTKETKLLQFLSKQTKKFVLLYYRVEKYQTGENGGQCPE